MVFTKMRWSVTVAALVVLMITNALAVVNSGQKIDQEGPPGLIEIKNVEDLVAEASAETQKREIPSGGLSNSYGEPIPADSYGPPIDDGHSLNLILPQSTVLGDSYSAPIKADLGLPIPVYGVPDDPSNHIKYPEPPPDIPPPITGQQVPHETYGPPKFANIPTVNGGHNLNYHGPPPPFQLGPPKPQYGPPKPAFGPSKPQFGSPKPQYGPPKIGFGHPKPIYGPPKQQFSLPKPQYGPPKHVLPKPQYVPPKLQYGPPKHGNPSSLQQLQHVPPPPLHHGPPLHISHGPPQPQYGPPPQILHGPPPQIPHGPPPQIPHGPPPQILHGPPPQIPHGPPPQIPHGPPPQILHGPPPQIPHGPPPQIPHGPPPQISYGPPPAISHGPPPTISHGPPPTLPHGPLPPISHGPPQIQYGVPLQITHGPPPQISHGPPPQIPHGPPLQIPHGPPPHKPHGPLLQQALPRPEYGPPKLTFNPPKPLFLQKPHPIYGLPIIPFDDNQGLKPSFPIPQDTYGPPGKPVSSGEHFSQLLFSEQSYEPPIGIHHGPPQPDPDPKPAHPGIPAPPTPPHILYDGWTPIPGVSKPLQENHGSSLSLPHAVEGSFISSLHSIGNSLSSGGSPNTFGIPAVSYGVPLQSLDVDSLSGSNDHSFSSNGFVSGGYSSVSGNEGLQGIDLNTIIGSSTHGDAGIGLQGSKTVFEAHYTEPGNIHENIESASHTTNDNILKTEGPHDNSFSVLQSVGFHLGSINSNSVIGEGASPDPRQLNYPSATSSHSDIQSPSEIYGIPVSETHGIPPPPPSHNTLNVPQLSISYGIPSGSLDTGSINPLGINLPKKPITFREPVPQGLIEDIGQTVVHKDILGVDNFNIQNQYIPPPVLELPRKETTSFASTSSHDNSFSIHASIEPSNLYSLPNVAKSINFNSNDGHGSNHIAAIGYSSSIDSYHAPLTAISDTYGAPSIQNTRTTTLDGKEIINTNLISNSDSTTIGTDASSLAAAILKNCPYHKALYEAAKTVEQNNLAVNNGELNSASSSNAIQLLPLSDNINLNGEENSEIDTIGSISSEVNIINKGEINKSNNQKGKSLNGIEDNNIKIQTAFNHNNQFQNIGLQSSQTNHEQILGQNYEVINGIHNIPIQGNLGSYTLQIQSADGLGQPNGSPDNVPHDQVLSEGLLQSILQAIEQPHQTQIIPQTQSEQQISQISQNQFFDLSESQSGLILPEGYEIQPRIKEKTISSEHRGDQEPDDETQETKFNPLIIVPSNSDSISKSFLEQFGLKSQDRKDEPEIVTPLNIIDDNEIAIYFNNDKNDHLDYDSDKEKSISSNDVDNDEDPTETVTEISVETTISASDEESQKNAQQYGDDIRLSKKGKYGEKINKKVDPKYDDKTL